MGRIMFPIDPSDEGFLRRSVLQGEVILVLGAGASFASRNKLGEPVKLGEALASVIAEAAGFPYNSESLPTVLSASRPILGDAKLLKIYENEFTDIEPADDIRGLSLFTWKRIYTFSIDDALNNSLQSRVQRPRFYNGMIDQVVESDNLANVQVIKLHGDITNPSHGFIMSDADYASALAHGNHAWYRKVAQDYVSYTPVFIGSRLSEPILSAELERAKRSPTDESGRGYIVTPDNLTAIEISAFRAKGLIHIQAKLLDFVNWLHTISASGTTPRDVLSRTHNFSTEDLDKKISNNDLESASALYPRDMVKIHARAASALPADTNREARRFLRGFPPTWDIAASDIPVWLTPTTDLYENLSSAIVDRERMFVVTGQAGSGKTTAVLQALVRYGREHQDTPIYELTAEVRSVRAALNILQRLHDVPVIVYISDLFVFGDQLSEDIQGYDRGKITVIATARKSEWSEHLSRRFGDAAIRYEYSRFTKDDYQPLIDRLIEYVPSPAFKALSPPERLTRIAHSREQLLIALREATYSQNFADVITNEFEKLPDEDTRLLLVIVGIATAARVGISPGMAKEAYNRVAKLRTFSDAERALDGIVSHLPSGRMFARHEVYVRHIIDDVVGLDALLDCLISISATYTKYGFPIVRNVNKIEAALFRFCWNHKFIFEQCQRRNRLHDGERLYSNFEIDFQLDGHFWLQYGLYLSECGKKADALVMLRRSIEAYPDNPFAVHAYAELQFQVALRRNDFDSTTRQLIGDAVESLERLDARKSDEIDQYPIVTLANLHIGTLVHYGQTEQAKQFSRDYFDRLQQMERRISAERITDAKERLLKYVTLEEWDTRRSDTKKGRNPSWRRPVKRGHSNPPKSR